MMRRTGSCLAALLLTACSSPLPVADVSDVAEASADSTRATTDVEAARDSSEGMDASFGDSLSSDGDAAASDATDSSLADVPIVIETGDTAGPCGAIVSAGGACPKGCHRIAGSKYDGAKACWSYPVHVCVGDDSVDSAILVCRVEIATGTVHMFFDMHAPLPPSATGWKDCTSTESALMTSKPDCP